MTRAEISKRISATVGAGLFLYVASIGPAMMTVGGLGAPGGYNLSRALHLATAYRPIFWVCEHSKMTARLTTRYCDCWAPNTYFYVYITSMTRDEYDEVVRASK